MLDEMTPLSPKGSYIILNYCEIPFKPNNAGSLDYMDVLLKSKGWTFEKSLAFGQDEFNYGRFHLDRPTDTMGFAFYSLDQNQTDLIK